MSSFINKINKKYLYSKRKVYYNTLKIMGLCSACFVFEACYGAPQDESLPEYNMKFSGTVKSEDSLKPIQNIKVSFTNSANNANYNTTTLNNGQYSCNTQINDKRLTWTIKTIDTDDSVNGCFHENEAIFIISGDEFNNNQKEIDILMKRK